MLNPTFVIVPGLCHTPIPLELAATQPESARSPVLVPQSTTEAPGVDAANIRRLVEELVDSEEKEVVLVCHSFGGHPGSQSVKGFEKSVRAKAGKKGGVTKIVFLTAVVPLEGENLMDVMMGAQVANKDWMDFDTATGTVIANANVTTTLYHDLPDADAQHWVSKLEPMAIAHAVPGPPAVDVCWDTEGVAKVYIFCKRDRAFTFEEQQRMAQRAREVQGGGPWETYEMDCGHSPCLSHVAELTEILVKA
ncbi:hypothetical protein C8R46DRAFT_1039464 [Mycena filopes]|nr:hypothetical protein C8R46DRAFT_1039464 [Mycena filopes]